MAQIALSAQDSAPSTKADNEFVSVVHAINADAVRALCKSLLQTASATALGCESVNNDLVTALTKTDQNSIIAQDALNNIASKGIVSALSNAQKLHKQSTDLLKSIAKDRDECLSNLKTATGVLEWIVAGMVGTETLGSSALMGPAYRCYFGNKKISSFLDVEKKYSESACNKLLDYMGIVTKICILEVEISPENSQIAKSMQQVTADQFTPANMAVSRSAIQTELANKLLNYAQSSKLVSVLATDIDYMRTNGYLVGTTGQTGSGNRPDSPNDSNVVSDAIKSVYGVSFKKLLERAASMLCDKIYYRKLDDLSTLTELDINTMATLSGGKYSVLDINEIIKANQPPPKVSFQFTTGTLQDVLIKDPAKDAAKEAKKELVKEETKEPVKEEVKKEPTPETKEPTPETKEPTPETKEPTPETKILGMKPLVVAGVGIGALVLLLLVVRK